MQNTKTASAFDLDRAQNLTWRELRGLLSERAEEILRGLGVDPGPDASIPGTFIDTRLFVKSIAPYLRMN